MFVFVSRTAYAGFALDSAVSEDEIDAGAVKVTLQAHLE